MGRDPTPNSELLLLHDSQARRRVTHKFMRLKVPPGEQEMGKDPKWCSSGTLRNALWTRATHM